MDKKKNISVIDVPSKSHSDDHLGVKDHADTLTKFIKECGSPIAVGIQGEWGSGKTSLLNIIHDNLEQDGDFLQIWVNAWEQSLLSKPEEVLLKIVNEIINEMTIARGLRLTAKSKIQRNFSTIAKGALRYAAAAGAGGEGKQVVDELIGDDSNSIKALRLELQKLANEIHSDTTGKVAKIKKIVIYVDDLDRIWPPDAVNILELLKNIFNIEHCVFVLAIDYSVVVKGLEAKFGKSTDENEWEFRAFFDKIIQLPFQMPIGQYDIGFYVNSMLTDIGFLDQGDHFEDEIKSILKLSIGGNPRALKRLVNSLSLIEIFQEIRMEKQGTQKTVGKDDLLLFALICMQIQYPYIYNILINEPNFRQWDYDTAFKITMNKEEENKEQFERDYKIAKQSQEFDQKWEQVLFKLCYVKPMYKNRAVEISKLLSFIDQKILGDLNKEATTKKITDIVNKTVVTSTSNKTKKGT